MKLLRHGLLFSFLFICCISTWALEYHPYPEAQITSEQWLSYYEEAIEKYGTTAQNFPKQHLIVLYNNDGLTSYAFTLKGHEAHPAWITRKVAEKNGAFNIEQIGYYAGEERPFAELFQAYLELNEQMKAQIQEDKAGETQ